NQDYRVHNPETNDKTTSRNVNIHEDLKTKIQNFTSAEIQNQIPDSVGDENEHSTNSPEMKDADSDDSPSYLKTTDDSHDIDYEPELSVSTTGTEPTNGSRRSERQRKAKLFYDYVVYLTPKVKNISDKVPETFSDAMSRADADM
ncbi:hypothetical protein WA026_023185, partial [Henosepilachna vigintioctopunctata]